MKPAHALERIVAARLGLQGCVRREREQDKSDRADFDPSGHRELGYDEEGVSNHGAGDTYNTNNAPSAVWRP